MNQTTTGIKLNFYFYFEFNFRLEFIMTHKFFNDRRPHNGLTYEEYNKKWIQEIRNTNIELLNAEDRELYNYKKLNRQRSERIEKNFIPSKQLIRAIKEINKKQLWMVITETWCGDSAQNLPYIAKIALQNPNINFRILLRDSNPDIMNLYLTNGTKSIPKLIAFDEDGNESFIWGPRPKEAQELIMKWKSEGIVKPELYEKLHLWYGRNRGKELEKEFIEILSRFVYKY